MNTSDLQDSLLQFTDMVNKSIISVNDMAKSIAVLNDSLYAIKIDWKTISDGNHNPNNWYYIHREKL